MKIAVIGLWHLGTVTSACLAHAGYEVIAYDSNPETITTLKGGKVPVYEPGLQELLTSKKIVDRLQYTSNLHSLDQAEIFWITIDTPVNDQDEADVKIVRNEIISILPHVPNNSLVIISSQVPVGFTSKMQKIVSEQYPTKVINFAYSPENLRLGKAIEVFTHPERVIVGLNNHQEKERILKLFNPFSSNIIFMSIASAEMTKHAINSFLANSVIFINEISRLCEQLGANAHEVELGLKSESRIGPKAYLRPGEAIAGGTLARDLNYLINLGEQCGVATPLFSALISSNNLHKNWTAQKLLEIFANLDNKLIAMLGLTYKTDTDTLRRSAALETCIWLSHQGAKINAYDPLVKSLPNELSYFINLKSNISETLYNADAIIITNDCIEFSELKLNLQSVSKHPYIIDAGGFLRKFLSHEENFNYISVGFRK